MTRAPENLPRAHDWRDEAACIGHDPELWFPNSSNYGPRTRQAKAICRVCLVRTDCLDDALRIRDKWAILGGLTVPDRERLTRNGARRCENCGARYVPRGNQQRYCSKNCQSVGYQRSQAGYEKRRGAA